LINSQSPQAGPALARARACGTWFIWIAGLSVVNSLITTFMPASHWGFFFGLGVTQIVDAVTSGTPAHIIGLIVDLVIAGVWVLFGLQAQKAKSWAFMTGMIFYVIDALILLPFGDWLGAAVHAYALFRIFPGFLASREYASLMKASVAGPYYSAPQPGVYPPAPGAYPQAPGAFPPQQPGAYPQQPTAFPPQPAAFPPQPAAYPQQPAAQPQTYGQNLDGTSSE